MNSTNNTAPAARFYPHTEVLVLRIGTTTCRWCGRDSSLHHSRWTPTGKVAVTCK